MQGGADGEREVGAQAQARGHLRAAEVQVTIAQARVLGGLLIPSSIWNGGVLERLSTWAWSTSTSISPVASLGFTASSPRLRTTPCTRMGHSGRMVSAILKASPSECSGSKLICVMPSRSRRSQKNQATVIAATAHPAGEGDLLAHVLGAKLAAGAGVHGMGVCGIGCMGFGHGILLVHLRCPVSIRTAGVQIAKACRQRVLACATPRRGPYAR